MIFGHAAKHIINWPWVARKFIADHAGIHLGIPDFSKLPGDPIAPSGLHKSAADDEIIEPADWWLAVAGAKIKNIPLFRKELAQEVEALIDRAQAVQYAAECLDHRPVGKPSSGLKPWPADEGKIIFQNQNSLPSACDNGPDQGAMRPRAANVPVRRVIVALETLDMPTINAVGVQFIKALLPAIFTPLQVDDDNLVEKLFQSHFRFHPSQQYGS